MPFPGYIVVIKKSGADWDRFPLVNEECLLGRTEGCDIRIRLPILQKSIVSKEHAKISVKVEDGSVHITALSRTNPTRLNGTTIDNDVQTDLRHVHYW